MRFFLSILGIRIRNYIARFFREATRKKYGWRSDLTVVSGEQFCGRKVLILEMESFETTMLAHDHIYLRSSAGHNALTRFGVVPNEASMITLMITPSAIRILGLRETYRFLRDWKGQSMVDMSPTPAVEYKFF